MDRQAKAEVQPPALKLCEWYQENSLILYLSKRKVWAGVSTFRRRKTKINAVTPYKTKAGRQEGR